MWVGWCQHRRGQGGFMHASVGEAVATRSNASSSSAQSKKHDLLLILCPCCRKKNIVELTTATHANYGRGSSHHRVLTIASAALRVIAALHEGFWVRWEWWARVGLRGSVVIWGRSGSTEPEEASCKVASTLDRHIGGQPSHIYMLWTYDGLLKQDYRPKCRI